MSSHLSDILTTITLSLDLLSTARVRASVAVPAALVASQTTSTSSLPSGTRASSELVDCLATDFMPPKEIWER